MSRSCASVYEPTGIETHKLGMGLFLASEVMFFTGLIGAYVVLRQSHADWPEASAFLNVPLAAMNTAVLFLSSLSMAWAIHSVRAGKKGALQRGLALTFLLGAVFLGIQGSEYFELLHKNVTPSNSLFGSVFFMLTGFHAAHVLGGIFALVFVWVKSLRGGYSKEDFRGVEIAGLYWHFVDAVWLVLFTVLYLV